MKAIDINCDMGEGFGAYEKGDDDAMLGVVSTVNLACGFHGGDPSIMARICEAAKVRGVAVGAHPGYPDLWGFGRRNMVFSVQELKHLVAYQVGASIAMAQLSGHRITHVKAHGALGHLVADDPQASEAYVDAIAAIDRELVVAVMATTALERAAEKRGLRIAREIFADRSYLENGRLTPRDQPGAVIHDSTLAAQRVCEMVHEQCIITASGKRIASGIDTICVHGDTPGAAAIAGELRQALETAGLRIAPFASAA